VCPPCLDFVSSLTSSWPLADAVSTTQKNVEPFLPIISATVTAAQQTDIAKAIKDGIDKLSEGMPVLMGALDELKTLHPFIGGEWVL